MVANQDKVILDLCGGTGAWSRPYKEAGYDVRNITLPEYNVLTYTPPNNVYGILAPPPCTHFSIACNRLWEEKDKDGRTVEGLQVLIGCLHIIALSKPVFWCLENPVGRMKKFLGEPKYIFSFIDFNFPCKKKSLLWGNFNPPLKTTTYQGEIYKVEEIDYKLPELRYARSNKNRP